MMNDLIEIHSHVEKSYRVVADCGTWKVALMNDMEKYRAENIVCMQKHNESDEVFILLSGRCVLFVADGDERPMTLTAVPMESGKVYNIKKGVWHTHVFAPDTQVFIVENSDTCDDNSPRSFDLSDTQKRYIRDFSDAE